MATFKIFFLPLSFCTLTLMYSSHTWVFVRIWIGPFKHGTPLTPFLLGLSWWPSDFSGYFWDPSSSLQFYVTNFCLKFLHCSTSLCGSVIYFSCFNYMHITIKYLAQIVLSRLQIHRFSLGYLSSALSAHSLQGSCFTSHTCFLSLPIISVNGITICQWHEPSATRNPRCAFPLTMCFLLVGVSWITLLYGYRLCIHSLLGFFSFPFFWSILLFWEWLF